MPRSLEQRVTDLELKVANLESSIIEMEEVVLTELPKVVKLKSEMLMVVDFIESMINYLYGGRDKLGFISPQSVLEALVESATSQYAEVRAQIEKVRKDIKGE